MLYIVRLKVNEWYTHRQVTRQTFVLRWRDDILALKQGDSSLLWTLRAIMLMTSSGIEKSYMRNMLSRNKRKRQPIGMLGRSSGNHDCLLANASACVSCGFRLRNARNARNASDCVWLETGLQSHLPSTVHRTLWRQQDYWQTDHNRHKSDTVWLGHVASLQCLTYSTEWLRQFVGGIDWTNSRKATHGLHWLAYKFFCQVHHITSLTDRWYELCKLFF